jgi:uncharacterized membrane protein
MKTLIVAYAATLVAFAVLDFLWLGRMGNVLYRPVMGDMVLDTFRPAPAIIFYLLYVIGLVYFAVRPALAAGDWQTALINGAALGFFAYATYDLTNQATLKNWSTTLSVVDMTWGTILSGVSALIGYSVTALILGSV